LNDWIPKISDDINLVLVDAKPDKRTVTYKTIKSSATVREFALWSDRDTKKAENWLMSEAKSMEFDLKPEFAELIVRRVGVDQWQLHHALQKVSLMGDVSIESINDAIESTPVESVFNLLEVAVRGDYAKLKQSIMTLKQTEDVFRLFALLSSQVFQLVAVAYADKNDNIARDFGIHPYAVTKMSDLARRLGKPRIKKMVLIMADSDADMKTSGIDPWLIVESALLKIASN
jgi:DNA polymerase-3 subunit delta